MEGTGGGGKEREDLTISGNPIVPTELQKKEEEEEA